MILFGSIQKIWKKYNQNLGNFKHVTLISVLLNSQKLLRPQKKGILHTFNVDFN